jgi:exopolysaccharide biosynthesis polyprenyl glycosylphosphotransferase
VRQGALTRFTGVSPTPFPILLQRRARLAVRKHARATALRLAVLLAADAAAILAVRAIGRLVRDHAALGEGLAGVTGAMWPVGASSGIRLVVPVVLGLLVTGTYGQGDQRRDVPRMLSGTLLGVLLMFWQRFWEGFSSATVGAFVVTFLCAAGAVLASRAVVEHLVRRVRPRRADGPRTLIIGSARDALPAMRHGPLGRRSEFFVVGFIDVALTPHASALGGVSDLVAAIEENSIDTVVLCGEIEADLFRDVLALVDAAGCHVYAAPALCGVPGYKPEVLWRRGRPLIEMTRPGLRAQQLFAKRLVDLVVAGLGMVLLAPVFAAVAVAVRLSSPGPVFFRQTRVGIGGRHFRIWKFRSMVNDAEASATALRGRSMYQDARLFKVADDPRVTGVGNFIRRTSLDELPQLFNVVRGDMSLVGPRPPLPQEVALYHELHYSRFDMKPGITGPWQVAGRNRITDFEEIVQLESAYMGQWSIWRDFEILFRTIPAVLRMDGAH